MKLSEITINQSNELLSAQYAMPLPQLRVVLMGLSKINSKRSNAGPISITTKEFSDAYGYHPTDAASIMRDAINNINKSPINMYIDNRIRSFHWFETTDVPQKDEEGIFYVQFSKTVEPYLFELKNNYSISEFEHIKKLSSSFQFRLYQWLKDGPYLGMDNFNKTDGEEALHTIQYEISWMKEKTNITGYDNWTDFKRRILKPTVDHLNASTNLSVFFEPVKTGRKVTHVKFSVLRENNSTLITKPIRPRLKRRPQVVSGSAAHGEWARININILMEYEAKLHEYDPFENLLLDDVRRLVEYNSIVGNTFEVERREQEIKARTSK